MPETQPPHFGEGLRKKLVDYAIAASFGFVAAWAQSQWTVNDLRNKIERLEEKEREATAAEVKRADAALSNAREMERLAGALNNLADRQKDMRDEQRKGR